MKGILKNEKKKNNNNNERLKEISGNINYKIWAEIKTHN